MPQIRGNFMHIHRLSALVGCLLVSGVSAIRAYPAAQQPSTEQSTEEIKPDNPRVWEHRLGPATAVHVNAAEARSLGFETYLTFEIVVSADGRVQSAKPIGDEKRHLDEGLSIERSRRFKPWMQEGKNIRVRVTDYVFLLPPERWALAPRSFPEPWDLKFVKIQLSRSACYGTCPIYSVTIREDGSVHFSGDKYVHDPGEHDAHIDPAAVRELVRQFEKANFFAAGDRYVAEVTDNPTYTLTLTVAGKTKTVTDYVGEQVGMPLVITDLENAVDDAAGTKLWIKGDAQSSAEGGGL